MSTFTPMVPANFPGHPAETPHTKAVPAKALPAKPLPTGKSPANKLPSDDRTLRLDPAEGSTAQSELALESAIAVLAQSSVAELRFLRVDEDEDTIHLSGSVRSFYHKQLAQEAVRPIAGDRLVVNRVSVRADV